jgi:hypothetical protein
MPTRCSRREVLNRGEGAWGQDIDCTRFISELCFQEIRQCISIKKCFSAISRSHMQLQVTIPTFRRYHISQKIDIRRRTLKCRLMQNARHFRARCFPIRGSRIFSSQPHLEQQNQITIKRSYPLPRPHPRINPHALPHRPPHRLQQPRTRRIPPIRNLRIDPHLDRRTRWSILLQRQQVRRRDPRLPAFS